MTEGEVRLDQSRMCDRQESTASKVCSLCLSERNRQLCKSFIEEHMKALFRRHLPSSWCTLA